MPGAALLAGVVLVACAEEPCQKAEDCPAGMLCIDGQCRPVCNSDRDCDANEVCLNGACADAIPCTSPDECDDHNVCTADSCTDEEVCRFDAAALAGVYCQLNERDGECVTENGVASCLLADGESCRRPDECASGWCADQLCCDQPCAGNCDRCNTAGSEGRCILVDSECTGNCDRCDALSGNCMGEVGFCSGSCAVCVGSGTSFTCEAGPEACDGECAVCSGAGTSFGCAANQELCPSSGDTLCTTCTGVGTNFACTFDADQDADCQSVDLACAAAGACAGVTGTPCAENQDCVSNMCGPGTCCDAVGPCVVSISAGSGHTCAALYDGTAWCWGADDDGQLGDDTELRSRSTPVQVHGLSAVQAVAVGTGFSCAMLTEGAVTCWGRNNYGQLGDDGLPTGQPVPNTQVQGITSASSISAGGWHACAQLTSGLACWGNGVSGQLGNGAFAEQPSPVAVAGIQDSIVISAGFDHTCAVLGDGAPRCWGRDAYGQLGNGYDTSDPQATPNVVEDLSEVSTMSAGRHHSCGVLDTGATYCWGSSSNGKLGIGPSTPNRYIPTQLYGFTGVVSITAGGDHTCALDSARQAWCWGRDSEGELGDSELISSQDSPVLVYNLFDVIEITAGDHHTCAVVADGTAWCWGAQSSDGTNRSRATPVRVAFGKKGVGDTCTAGNECGSELCYLIGDERICLYDDASCTATGTYDSLNWMGRGRFVGDTFRVSIVSQQFICTEGEVVGTSISGCTEDGGGFFHPDISFGVDAGGCTLSGATDPVATGQWE